MRLLFRVLDLCLLHAASILTDVDVLSSAVQSPEEPTLLLQLRSTHTDAGQHYKYFIFIRINRAKVHLERNMPAERELPALTAQTAAFPPPDVNLSVTLPDLHTPTANHTPSYQTPPFEVGRPSVPTHVNYNMRDGSRAE